MASYIIEVKNENCPYNPSHRVINFRMDAHIVQCRKEYVQSGKELTYSPCKYNEKHQIPSLELEYHEAYCEDGWEERAAKEALEQERRDKLEKARKEELRAKAIERQRQQEALGKKETEAVEAGTSIAVTKEGEERTEAMQPDTVKEKVEGDGPKENVQKIKRFTCVEDLQNCALAREIKEMEKAHEQRCWDLLRKYNLLKDDQPRPQAEPIIPSEHPPEISDEEKAGSPEMSSPDGEKFEKIDASNEELEHGTDEGQRQHESGVKMETEVVEAMESLLVTATPEDRERTEAMQPEQDSGNNEVEKVEEEESKEKFEKFANTSAEEPQNSATETPSINTQLVQVVPKAKGEECDKSDSEPKAEEVPITPSAHPLEISNEVAASAQAETTSAEEATEITSEEMETVVMKDASTQTEFKE